MAPKRLVPRGMYATMAEYEEAKREQRRMGRMLQRQRIESTQEATEHYLAKRGKRPPVGCLTVAERRRLKAVFDRLDVDHSGHISATELLGPLLGVGMASSEADVRAFVDRVDSDRSGKIDFAEFTRAVETAHKAATLGGSRSLPTLPVLPLVELQRPDSGNLDMAVRVSIGRRRRLLDTIQTALPTTAKIDDLRHQEAQLRAKLVAERHLQDKDDRHKLRGLQRERRALQRANANSAKLISALDHALRVDQHNLLYEPSSDK